MKFLPLQIAVFSAGFLLFVIQPFYAKFLLPYFGGVNAVWTIAIFFFTSALLLGYLYAYLIVSMPRRFAVPIHVLLLGALGAWLIIDGDILTIPGDAGPPALIVLSTLISALALPIVVLASTTIIAQHIYAGATREPYGLYRLSNLGSFLGLLSYPLFFELFTGLSEQASWWRFVLVGYAALMVFAVVCWWPARLQGVADWSTSVTAWSPSKVIMLGAIPTFFLVAFTEFLAKGIASFPLLWALPLALYLLSFVVAFKTAVAKQVAPLGLMTLVLAIATIALTKGGLISSTGYWLYLGTALAAFFTLAVYFHATIYNLRPHATQLGSFYLALTLGGSLGSALVSFVLPYVLPAQIELHWALGALILALAWRYRDFFSELPRIARYGLGVLLVISVCTQTFSLSYDPDSIATVRNFYGPLSVNEYEIVREGERLTVRSIANGSILHGLQVQTPGFEKQAASYYGPDSGIDFKVRSFVERGIAPRIAVVGMGVGMMNAYCDDVSRIDYIEINPAVDVLAREYFSYLEQCPEKTEVIIGDGRLELEALRGQREYDIIMLDAFTDDAIPLHLLTLDALTDAYVPLLAEQGVIAFHITNRYLDLRPPLATGLRRLEFEPLAALFLPDAYDGLQFDTFWLLGAREPKATTLAEYGGVAYYTNLSELVWTDDRASVISVLSWRGSSLE